MSIDNQDIINEWVSCMGLTIRPVVDTSECQDQVVRLLYTWCDCFATSCIDIKATDLIEHSIDLILDACPIKAKLLKYSHYKWEFANCILPEMEVAGIII